MKLQWFVLITAMAFAVLSAGAQHARGTHSTLHEPATLLAGMGSLHHPIATMSEEAQKFFDQGLTLDYAFNHSEAVRSFERAAELDPRSPMPYWGIALALGPNYNEAEPDAGHEKAAYDAIQKAKTLAGSAPENERAYVDALARRFTMDPKPDYRGLGRAYAAAMRDLSRRYPDDPDAAALFAESLMGLNPWELWTNDGKPGENTLEIVSVLEGVLRSWPDHIGANHFYIHTMEAAPDPERALASAHRLETLAPAAAHLVHMPAHIYMRTGDYAAAIKSNRQAVAVDDAFHRAGAAQNMTYLLLYGHHNLHFMAAAAMMDGDFGTAREAAKELESRANADVADTPMAEMYLPTPVFVLLRYGRWDDVLSLPQPDTKLKGLMFVWHYARGCAFAAEGDAAKAEAERDMMETIYKQFPAGPAFGMMYNDWSTIHGLAVGTLDARIAAARGDLLGAIEKWKASVLVQDHMNYDEPPDWYYPVRESLGAALLCSGKAAEAEEVFRGDLQKNPRNPRSLFGLWKSLEAQKRTVDAQWVRTSFEAAWKGGPLQPRMKDF
ncbi:MAG: hypothetical protein ACRD2H_08775 [Terriglobales bacterium]